MVALWLSHRALAKDQTPPTPVKGKTLAWLRIEDDPTATRVIPCASRGVVHVDPTTRWVFIMPDVPSGSCVDPTFLSALAIGEPADALSRKFESFLEKTDKIWESNRRRSCTDVWIKTSPPTGLVMYAGFRGRPEGNTVYFSSAWQDKLVNAINDKVDAEVASHVQTDPLVSNRAAHLKAFLELQIRTAFVVHEIDEVVRKCCGLQTGHWSETGDSATCTGLYATLDCQRDGLMMSGTEDFESDYFTASRSWRVLESSLNSPPTTSFKIQLLAKARRFLFQPNPPPH